MKTTDLNKFRQIYKHIPKFYNSINNIFPTNVENCYNNSTNINFLMDIGEDQVSITYDEGQLELDINTQSVIKLVSDFCLEYSGFDEEDEIKFSLSDSCVYFQLFKNYSDVYYNNDYEIPLHETFYDTNREMLIFEKLYLNEKIDEFHIFDANSAKHALFQLSLHYDNLVSEEEFVNSFIAYFELRDIMKQISTDYSVQINLGSTENYDTILSNIKLPKVILE